MVNVFDFGAAGDGKTDDTEALEHALEAGDGVLRLAKGTYRISRPIVLDTTKTGYAAVIGEGGTSRIVMTGPGPAIRVLGDHRGTASPITVKDHTYENERFPNLTGFEIVGEHPEAVGIELRKTHKTTISRVLVRNCKHGIHLVERNRDFILSDSHLYDNSEYGLFFDECNLHQAIVHGNHISWNKKAGIKSLNGDVHNLHITWNDIEYNHHPGVDKSPNGETTGAEIWFEATDGVISEVTIASNTIQATIQPGGANIRVFGSETTFPRGARLIAITGNVLGSQNRAIDIRQTYRVTVLGNTIYDSEDLSIYAKNCESLAIGSNTFVWRGDEEAPQRDGILFEDCSNGSLIGLVAQRLCSGSEKTGGAITLVRCKDIAISECQILDSLHRGVELIDCERCRVSGNSIIDRKEKPSMLQAVRVQGNSRDNLIQNNMLGGARDVLILADTEKNHLQGNIEL